MQVSAPSRWDSYFLFSYCRPLARSVKNVAILLGVLQSLFGPVPPTTQVFSGGAHSMELESALIRATSHLISTAKSQSLTTSLFLLLEA
jgi:hypothetical protein